ncbi:conserved hypothetical protein [Culex quinquefasciatus]|uniref:Ribonuclease H1 N-terminal domain-containing protein n=1 Tax=Culex quinquefasciatus TaxID=7176 RepID=B0XG43_CULQU|nr:conserved hypothetical protein [Culex quinquefasciatus]|eukprot:XP_001868615.1 conserved hypothetical protein [Culex quinquefasciatus]
MGQVLVYPRIWTPPEERTGPPIDQLSANMANGCENRTGQWPKCQQQVTGFTGAKFKKFPTRQQADAFVREHGSGSVSGSASDSGSSSEKGKKLDSGVKPVTKLENYGTYNFHQDEDGFVYVYTDGSCEGNGTAAARAGMGVYFDEGHALNARNAWKLSMGKLVKNQVDFEELDRELANKSIEIKSDEKEDSTLKICTELAKAIGLSTFSMDSSVRSKVASSQSLFLRQKFSSDYEIASSPISASSSASRTTRCGVDRRAVPAPAADAADITPRRAIDISSSDKNQPRAGRPDDVATTSGAKFRPANYEPPPTGDMFCTILVENGTGVKNGRYTKTLAMSPPFFEATAAPDSGSWRRRQRGNPGVRSQSVQQTVTTTTTKLPLPKLMLLCENVEEKKEHIGSKSSRTSRRTKQRIPFTILFELKEQDERGKDRCSLISEEAAAA